MGRNRRRKGGHKPLDVPALNPCRVCGKRFGVTPSSRLSRKASIRIARTKDVCPSCWLAEQAETAAPKARALGLPELVGTAKQKQYALILRQEHVEAEMPRLTDEPARQDFLSRVSSQTSAKWWIENSHRGRSSPKQSRFDPTLVTEPVVQFDGGCTKNPGGVGTFGALLRIGRQIKDAVCGGIGKGQTSNRAEYHGLIEGLRLAIKHLPPGSPLHVAGDSLLVIRQMRGEWRVLDSELEPLFGEARGLAAQLGSVTYYSIPRGKNREADFLTRAALKGCEDALGALSGFATPLKSGASAVVSPAPPVNSQAPKGSPFVVAVAAGGQDNRLAGCAVVWQADEEVARFSSPCGPGEKLPRVLRRLVENAWTVIKDRCPEGGNLILLSREETLIDEPPAFPACSYHVRRPGAGEEARFNRAKLLAREAASAVNKPSASSMPSQHRYGTDSVSAVARTDMGKGGVVSVPRDQPGQNRKKAKKGKKQKRKSGKRSLYPGESTVREFNRAREAARALGLPRLMYGTEIQHENATSIRHNFVAEQLRVIDQLCVPNSAELKDRLLAAVKKCEFSKWWLDEKDRLHQHFADVLPAAKPTLAETEPPAGQVEHSTPSP